MELMTGGLQLKIVNTTIEDTGAFKCRAVNPAGEDSVEMDLEVMGEVNYRGKCPHTAGVKQLYSVQFYLCLG